MLEAELGQPWLDLQLEPPLDLLLVLLMDRQLVQRTAQQ